MPSVPPTLRRLRRKVSALAGSGVALRELRARQDGRRLHLALAPAPGYRPVAVWTQGPEGGWTRLADLAARGPRFEAVVDLRDVPGEPADHRLVLQMLHWEYEPADGGRTVRAPLAAARRTTLDHFVPEIIAGRRLSVAATEDGTLAVVVGTPLPPFGSIQVSLLRVVRGVVHLRGRISTRHGHLGAATFVLRGRTTHEDVEFPVRFSFDERKTATSSGLRFYRYALRVDLRRLADGDRQPDDFYDAFMAIVTEQDPEPHYVRVGRTPFHARYLTNSGWAERDGRAIVVNPYYTFKAQRTSFQVSVLDADDYRYLRQAVRTRHLRRLRHHGAETWLVGERPSKAQDNGLHFFRYLRQHHPDVAAYYVIDPRSPERRNVEPLGNVLDYRSKEHVRVSLLATKVAGTHHADFLFPLRTKEFRRAVRATRVFLQHGVMGTKWMANLYGKGAGFDTDLFVVSSEHERDYIASDFGFDREDIAVTGLSRFDALFAGDVAVRPRQILVLPTWRDWLQNIAALPDSEYLDRWSGLLHHPEFRRVQREHDLEIVFCPHPNMQQFRHFFDDLPVRVVGQGEVDIQHLLKESALLVTDYSSVGFDFAFLDKPVVYFQFDRDKFLGEEGSHLDLDSELPGRIEWTADAVVEAVERSAADGFPIRPQDAERAARFLAHRDRENSARIYEAALRTRRHRDLAGRFLSSPIVSAGWRYLRRSRYYFPAMRLLYRLALRLPADPNLVVFESGVGRQYADSPRYIYEELLRRKSPMTKVWFYDRRLPVTDDRTKVVPRLSPAYYYYLARARYWVNNQSFPHYVRRRPDTVFVQTWHGTPLKRMLWDLDAVHGRDSGYLERATRGAAQWTVLVSPGPFATKAIRSAFRYEGEVLELGYPRNDVLYSPDRDAHAERVRRSLGLRPGQRAILYAPTFRDDQVDGTGKFVFALPLDLERFHERLGDDTVLLLRMHVLVRNAIQIPVHLRDWVRDVSSYPEMQELYLASDVLVTDYSSVFFDYAALRRPTVFYAYDIERYRDDLRGFYLDYESVIPGPMVTSEDELLDVLEKATEVDAAYADRRERFLAEFAPHDDAHSAARVVDAVFGPEAED